LQQQLQLKQLDSAVPAKPADDDPTARDDQKPEIVYADIVKPTNTRTEPEVIYVNLPGAANPANDNDAVVYSELHACDLSDLYAKVKR